MLYIEYNGGGEDRSLSFPGWLPCRKEKRGAVKMKQVDM